MFDLARLTSLNSSEQVLLVFGSIVLLLGLLALTGLLSRIAARAVRLVNLLLDSGFRVWQRFFSILHWSLLLIIVLVVQALGWLGHEPAPVVALLTGILLLLVGVTACMAYVVLDQERYDVARGYKVLHNPGKGQEVADRLLHYGAQAGLPMLLVACLATLTGFTQLNLGLYDLFGASWCVVGEQHRHAPWPELVAEAQNAPRQADYLDFLAYSLLHLAYAVDLIDLLNHSRLGRIAYVHPSHPAAAVVLTLFRTFFTAVLLRQLFAWYRDRRLLHDSLRDFWSTSEPIQRRASETLTQQGTRAVRALIRSAQAMTSLTPEQLALLPEVVAAVGPSVVPLLLRYLKQPQETVREVAMAALGRLQAVEALPELEHAAADPSDRVRQCVAVALGEIFAPGPVAVRKRWRMRSVRNRRGRWLRLRRAGLDIGSDPVERGVAALRRLAGDPVRAVRLAAVDALRGLGPAGGPAAEELAPLAGDEDPAIRQRVAEALGAIRGSAEQTVPALLGLLDDPIPAVRLTAVQALAMFREHPTVVPVLIPLLQDADDDVRQAAAEAIGESGALDPRLLPRLTAGLRSRDNVVQARAAEALGSIGSSAAAAVPALIEALQDDSDRVRQRAAWALGQMGEAAAAEPLGRALADSDYRVAAEAATSLGRLGEKASAATEALLHAAGHINALVRRSVAAALCATGPGPGRVLPVLLVLARDPNLEVQLAALAALGRFQQPAARERLRAALADANPRVRIAAVRALQVDGAPPAELVPLLLPLLDDPNVEVVVEVVAALGRLEHAPTGVVRRLGGLLHHESEAVQVAAARALGQLGPLAAGAAGDVIRALERGAAAVREQALRVLLQLETPDRTSACLAALHDAHDTVRRLASAGLVLAAPLSPEAMPAVLEGMKDSDAQVRSNLAMILAKQEQLPVGAVPALLRCLEDPDDGLRLNALRALQDVPEQLVEVLPRLLVDPNGQVAFLAAACLLRRDARYVEAGVILERSLRSEIVRDRRQAVEALERLGVAGARFAEAVRGQLEEETDAELRESMSRLLAGWAEPEATAEATAP